jgi:hypothetical protein
MIGLKPICASNRPAKMPHGPKPTTIGRSCTAGVADELVADVRGGLMLRSSANLLQQLGFVAGFEVDGVDEQQFAVLLARIVAALEQGEASSCSSRMPRRWTMASRSASSGWSRGSLSSVIRSMAGSSIPAMGGRRLYTNRQV